MFYTSNSTYKNTDITQSDVKAYHHHLAELYNDDGSSSAFSSEIPYSVCFSSCDPDSSDAYYRFTCINPVSSYHTCSDQDSTMPFLRNSHLHQHDFFEFMFVLEGNVYITIDNQRHLYTKGSAYLLNRNVRHSEELDCSCRIAFLQISKDVFSLVHHCLSLNYFKEEKSHTDSLFRKFMSVNLSKDSELSHNYLDLIPIETNNEISTASFRYLDALTRETLSPIQGSSFRVINILCEFFEFLSDERNYSTTPILIGSTTAYDLFTKIAKIMEKCDGRISRKQLSEELNYSGAYLNEISKKYSGMTLFDFGMTYCMKKAAYLLCSTKMNIMDISQELGFQNRTHFYSIFKKNYGMTPGEYRRINTKKRD